MEAAIYVVIYLGIGLGIVQWSHGLKGHVAGVMLTAILWPLAFLAAFVSLIMDIVFGKRRH